MPHDPSICQSATPFTPQKYPKLVLLLSVTLRRLLSLSLSLRLLAKPRERRESLYALLELLEPLSVQARVIELNQLPIALLQLRIRLRQLAHNLFCRPIARTRLKQRLNLLCRLIAAISALLDIGVSRRVPIAQAARVGLR